MQHDDLDDLIAQLDRDAERYRWHRSLIELLDEVERTTEDPPPPGSTGTSSPGSSRGIDLAAKYLDIRCLVGKFGLRACRTNGWDFEELLSDVYVKIATSNLSDHPFDPSRARFSTYVVLAIRSVIVNKWRRQMRGQSRRHVAIDDPECHLQLREYVDLDRTLRAAREWSRLESEEPELARALMRNEGRIHRTRDELKVGYADVYRVRGEMLAALGG